MEFFPVSVFLVFHLDDDHGRQTDRRQTRELAKLSSEWSTQDPKGNPATIAYAMARHATKLVPLSCNCDCEQAATISSEKG